MRLTDNFTLKELTKTNTGLPNLITDLEIDNLTRLCQKVLQPLRDIYGKPIIVNSGYRSERVNKAVGGVPTSQHRRGEAADVTAGSREENKKLFEILKTMVTDQTIDEKNYTWIHVSYTICKHNRNQILHL